MASGNFKTGSGRLELANAIASKDNPLTARVFVNRVWMYHFGRGIVATPSNFGQLGERPTHPELLDYLASEFMARAGASSNSTGKSCCLTPMRGAPRRWSRTRRRMRRIHCCGARTVGGWMSKSLRDSMLYVSGNLDAEPAEEKASISRRRRSGRCTGSWVAASSMGCSRCSTSLPR